MLRIRQRIMHQSFQRRSNSTSVAEFVIDLQRRGLISESYPSSLIASHGEQLRQLPCGVYAGFDPTAPSLHLGNLVVLLNLFRSRNFGCSPIVIIGGSTALVGDPSGRTHEREEQHREEIAENAKKIQRQVQKMWETAVDQGLLERASSLHFINNSLWYSEMTLLQFLEKTRSLRVGAMLRTRAIKSRLEAGPGGGLSFPEFAYQTMQALDWKMLSDRYQCRFQLGGSDQLGHLDVGSHLIGRCTGEWAAGVCLPLLTDSDGNKIGKSTGGGGMWLDSKRTSPFHLFQSMRQLHDDDSIRMLYTLSLRHYDEIQSIESDHKSRLGAWVAQQSLAEEITTLVHGAKAMKMAAAASRALYYGSSKDLHALPSDVLQDAFGTPRCLRSCEFDPEKYDLKMKTFGDLAEATRVDRKNGHTLMKAGAFKARVFYVNGTRAMDPEEPLPSSIHLEAAPGFTIVCWGKRKFQLIQWV